MWLFENFLVLVSVLLIVAGAATAAKVWLAVDTYAELIVEVPGRLFPRPLLTVRSVRRGFVNALTGQRVLMPSGEVLAGQYLVVRMAPEDVDRLAPHGTVEDLEEDGATLYERHAALEGWRSLGPATVRIVVDERLRAGWIPPARIVADFGHPKHDTTGPGLSTQAVSTAAMTATEAVAPPMKKMVPVEVSYAGADYIVTDPLLGLGRTSNGRFAVTEPTVSWKHAMLEFVDGGWWVRDLGSRNGTSVDGTRLSSGGRAAIVSRAIVQLSDAVIRVRVHDE